jgi:hypothetical protein
MRFDPRLATGVAAVALVILPQVVISQESVILRRKVRTGETFRYSMNIEFEIESRKAFFSTTTTDRVAENLPDGETRFETTQTNSRMVLDSQVVPVRNDSLVTFTTVDRTGLVTAVTGDLTDATTYRIANMMSFRYPNTAVAVDGSWTVSFEADAKKGTPAAIVTYTFQGREPVAGTDSARIQFNYRELDGLQPARSSGMIWIDVETGIMTRLDAAWQNAPMPGAPAPVQARVRILIQR